MLYVQQFKSSDQLYELFYWLIILLNEQKQKMPRIMIFCRSIGDVGTLYTVLRSRLSTEEVHHLSMYHSNTLDEVKSFIQSDMTSSTGKIRVLICTTAAGMGLNFSTVNYIIHYGPPYTADSLIQHMGRAGRDGSQSFHLLLYTGRQKRGVDDEVLSYIASSDCRRKQLMSYYGGIANELINHLCCDNCAATCACGEDDCALWKTFPLLTLSPQYDSENDEQPGDSRKRAASTSQINQLECKLSALFVDHVCLTSCNDIDKVINDIVSNVSTIYIIDDIVDIWQPCCETIENDILCALHDVFHDITI